jgi:hypothetical protein
MPTKELRQVTAITKANIYFDGKVVSHTLLDPSGAKTTLGLIYPGEYHFNTDAPESMEIVSGTCRVRVDGSGEWKEYNADSVFTLPGKAGFDIHVTSGITEYICRFE